tara:strand:+ start:70 stop:582 length:513 start_codon:yes stop_codon:yes gene_type:complete
LNKKITKLLSDNLSEINSKLNEGFEDYKSIPGYDKHSTKLKSEILSNLIESVVSDLLKEAIAPGVDHMADLIVDGTPLEIKTTATSDSWRGGEFSKRPGDYIMVGWEEVSGVLKTFMLHTFLEKNHWKSSGSGNYYATSISLSEILDKVPFKVLKGGLEKKRIKTHMVKV